MDANVSVTWLKRTWWVIFPAFALLTARLAIERSCSDPYDLLPATTSHPAFAWPLAAVYVLAHVWIVGAYLVTASRARTLVPAMSAWSAAWGKNAPTVVAMVAALAVEYAPVALWAFIGAQAGCRL